jgi:DNA replication protein DnaC
LILDDIDFYETSKNSSAFLFKLLMERDRKGVSTILTSNKHFDQWGELFGTKDRAKAVVDRFVGKSEMIPIVGDSYRVKDQMAKFKTIAAQGK